MKKPYFKNLQVNPELDPESHKYISMMQNFGDVKELVIQFFKENTHPNERLKLMRNERKLAMGKVCGSRVVQLKAENRKLKEVIWE